MWHCLLQAPGSCELLQLETQSLQASRQQAVSHITTGTTKASRAVRVRNALNFGEQAVFVACPFQESIAMLIPQLDCHTDANFMPHAVPVRIADRQGGISLGLVDVAKGESARLITSQAFSWGAAARKRGSTVLVAPS